jgi:hypothetical protein
MLQNWIGSKVREGKNFETQRRQGLKHKGTKAQRHKVFCNTKLLINGKCFQPFELIEHIEPFERFS